MKQRESVQGFFVDLLDFQRVVELCLESVRNSRNLHIVTINPEIIQAAKKNLELAEIIKSSDLVTPDGVGVKIALKLKGISQPLVSGFDLSLALLDHFAKENIPVSLIGAKNEVLDKTVAKIKEKHPNINIAYVHDGFFEDFESVADEVANSDAKLVLCAMGSPRQDYFISKLKEKINGAVMIGVGGTFDVISGAIKPAPKIYKKLGLEWLYRTIKQPERFKRIFPTLPIFFFQSIIDSARNKS